MPMQYTVHVAITTGDGQTETREIANVGREDLPPPRRASRAPKAQSSSKPYKRWW